MTERRHAESALTTKRFEQDWRKAPIATSMAPHDTEGPTTLVRSSKSLPKVS
jgi:hypothetical protein